MTSGPSQVSCRSSSLRWAFFSDSFLCIDKGLLMLMTDLCDELARQSRGTMWTRDRASCLRLLLLGLSDAALLGPEHFLDLRPALGPAGASGGPDLPSACRCVSWARSWF